MKQEAHWLMGKHKHYCMAIRPRFKTPCKNPAMYKVLLSNNMFLYVCKHHANVPKAKYELIKTKRRVKQ